MNLPTPAQNGSAHIVDDNEAVRDSTRALLVSWGIDVRIYASGLEFVDSFDPSAGGCIILDLHMPDVSGFQILDILRKRGNTVPIVLFSGRADPATEELARLSGAVALLAKPVREDELIGLVQRLLDPNNAMGPPAFTSGQCTPRAA